MKIIAVMNQKGGIGKTMTAAAIAYIMGEEKGKKVLICDADQQGNISLLYDRFDPEGQGMSELLENHQAAGGGNVGANREVCQMKSTTIAAISQQCPVPN